MELAGEQVKLGPKGVEEVYGLGEISAGEAAGVEALKPELRASIEKGIAFAASRE